MKFLRRIIMATMRNKVTPEIAEKRCEFVEVKGKRNAIYVLRTVHRDLHACFTEHTKAFD